MLRKLFCVAMVMAVGCASPQNQPENPVTNSSPAPITPQPTLPAVVTLGQSVKGAPITMQIFGAGGPTIFIMAGIHGNEPHSVELVDQLIASINQHPEQITGRRVAILRVANPDGFAANRRVNANGVDLNRNFPADNYKGSRRYGNTAASQPETRAIIAALDQLQPNLIVSIHSIDDNRQCNNYDGPAEAVAALMGRYNHYPAEATIGYPTPGSLGSYAGIDRKIPMITLELPDAKLSQQGWTENRDALLAAIRGEFRGRMMNAE